MLAERLQRAERASDLEQQKLDVTELETAWDQGQTRIRPMSPEKWTLMDAAIEDVLQKVRSEPHDAAATSASLETLVALIHALDGAG
jgi:hypothetical protein